MILLLMIILFHVDAPEMHQRSDLCTAVSADFKYPNSPQVHILEQQRSKELKGKVSGPGGVEISGPVLVEIIRGRNNEERIAACLASSNGIFDFGHKRTGHYYLKVSMLGFDTTYVQVVLGKAKTTNVDVELRPST
jgi:hypothetical protein